MGNKMEIKGANQVCKMLDLSTGHLPYETVQMIENGTFGKPVLAAGEYGFLFSVPEADDINNLMESHGVTCESFILATRRACVLGCVFILFDRDAEIIEDLPLFDW